MTRTRLILTLSIVLNIFLIGAVVGSVTWQKFGHRMIAAGSLRVAGAELPAEQRRAFRAAIRQTRMSLSDTIARGREAKARAATLLRQAEVDRDALFAALREARAADLAVREAIEKRAVAFALDLPPEDRARLAEAVEDRVLRAIEKSR